MESLKRIYTNNRLKLSLSNNLGIGQDAEIIDGTVDMGSFSYLWHTPYTIFVQFDGIYFTLLNRHNRSIYTTARDYTKTLNYDQLLK